VRRIFAEYATGKSPRRIAADLNAEHIPSPRGGQWNASTINGHRGRRNGILQNELYTGKLVHNRVRMLRDPETGKRISRINPETEWVRVETPELRIISDKLWNEAQRMRRRYLDKPSHNCRRPKRLLSGLLKCGRAAAHSQSFGPTSMAVRHIERKESALTRVKSRQDNSNAGFWRASKCSFLNRS